MILADNYNTCNVLLELQYLERLKYDPNTKHYNFLTRYAISIRTTKSSEVKIKCFNFFLLKEIFITWKKIFIYLTNNPIFFNIFIFYFWNIVFFIFFSFFLFQMSYIKLSNFVSIYVLFKWVLYLFLNNTNYQFSKVFYFKPIWNFYFEIFSVTV